MKLRLLPASLLLVCTLTHAANPEPIPKSLEEQVGRLVELIRDSYATGYPEAAQVQTLKTGKDRQVTLAVFIIEGFGLGNNYSQYLAAFSSDANEEGKVHYSLLDVIKIGAGGWRSIEKLDAKLISNLANEQVLIDIPVMENTSGDATNFPSRAGVIHLSLEGLQSPRLVEKN
ncbi:hypothetical protein [Pseudomonas citronellolis]|uniref:hypothetical protein n=1 Tax=Pseudomonas citronellolis TaxID=53408 RepID=UPI00209F7FD7|nr:hypothetical protein [Pseudomonas citronellolis]MCP1645303.1 hypothetical protein [Pseudomonas citronellolis]MCP1668058.1 hypothetical protein [Pseudomonas citronellolis]MCP1699468.1 hypothetical protein [Pseudomonas citronellolis]MCP1705999.1 hypothetical protein [Pseudomonas citronellolis]MCP1799948.1 hypothetical protein [Pseudomonas citronellolis]